MKKSSTYYRDEQGREWSVDRVEKDDASPGYRWLAETAELGGGERYGDTKRELLRALNLKPVRVPS